jgi:hypothetical protein
VDYRERKIEDLRKVSEVEFKDTHTFAPKITRKWRSKSKRCLGSARLLRSESSYSQLGMKYLKSRRSKQFL